MRISPPPRHRLLDVAPAPRPLGLAPPVWMEAARASAGGGAPAGVVGARARLGGASAAGLAVVARVARPRRQRCVRRCGLYAGHADRRGPSPGTGEGLRSQAQGEGAAGTLRAGEEPF